jgi:hypothetical protein
MATRYPDAPESIKGNTIKTGNWFQDYARDLLEKVWGVSPKSYHSSEFQLKYGEGRFAEFKHDPHTKYKHLSIEVAERAQANGRWAPAGIYRATEPFYIQGDKHSVWVFPLHMLQQYAEGCGVYWDEWNFIDKFGITRQFNETMIRFFLEYEDAVKIGGIEIVCNSSVQGVKK